MNNNYTLLGELLDEADCVYNRVRRQLNIVHRWIPSEARGQAYDNYVEAKVEKIGSNLYVKRLNLNCESNIIMDGASFHLELQEKPN